METAILTGGKLLAPTFVKSMLDSGKGVFKNMSAELKQIVDDGLTSYLGKYESNYNHVKTILHRHEPVPFYDVYFPVKLEREDLENLKGRKEIETLSVNRIFWRTPFITVTGNAGSGKSTLVKHIFLNCIKEEFGIPIIVELRNLVYHTDSVYNYIKEIIFINNLAKSENIFERLLSEGKFVFLIDGFDEVKREMQSSVLVQLNSFIDKYNHNRYMLTSRPGVNIDLFPFFHNYKMKELEGEEIYEFIKKQKLSQATSNSVIDYLKERKKDYLDTYLKNPLLLTLYLVTYSNNSTVPNKKSLFYRRVFDVLFREHDTLSKVGYERNLTTKLSQEKIEETLKLFSFITFFDNHYTFDKDYLVSNLTLTKEKLKAKHTNFPDFDIEHFIYDLKVSIGIWVQDESYIYFVHRSMQEYFTALSIQNANTNKENIYMKIMKKLDRGFISIDSILKDTDNLNPYSLSNLLSLCDEMDFFPYNKYIKIPLMKEMLEIVDKEDEDERIKMVLKLNGMELNFKITKDKRNRHILAMVNYSYNKYKILYIDRNNEENKRSTISINFFGHNYSIPKKLQKKRQEPTDFDSESMRYPYPFYISFNDDISLDWIPMQAKKNISDQCDIFISELKNNLIKLENHINNIAKSEFTLSDLI